MELIILDNGGKAKDMAKENNTGMTVLTMKDIGKTIWRMAKED